MAIKSISVAAAAAALGRIGGVSRSAAKVAAARANGRKGGRPRKCEIKNQSNQKG